VKFDSLAKRLGSQIVVVRQKKGITQAELAKRSEISLKYVSMIESGTNSSLRTLLKLCDGLEVNLPTLLEQARKARPQAGKKKRVNPLHVSIPDDCPHFKKLVSYIRKMGDEERALALEILRSL
jgi:transcriptional regulator with XRE-family HTH domain